MQSHPYLTDVSLMRTWSGEAPAILALHGFTGGGDDFAPLAEHLSRRIIAPDLPGHQQTGRPVDERPFSVASWAGSLREAITRDSVVLGYSMGARVALQLAATAPLGALILISGTPGIQDADARALRRAQDDRLAAHLEEVGLETFLKEWSQKPIIATQGRAPTAVQTILKHVRETRDADGLAKSLRGCGTGSMDPLWSALESVRCPTLLIAGEEDTKFTDIAHEMHTRIPSASLVVFEETGHAPHFEHPARVAHVIADFLETL